MLQNVQPFGLPEQSEAGKTCSTCRFALVEGQFVDIHDIQGQYLPFFCPKIAENIRKHLGNLTCSENRSVVWFGAKEGAYKAATLSSS